MSKKVITFYDSEKQSHDFPIITPDYGTCSTASSTSAKVVICDDFSLFTGAEITVKFTNVPTTDTITLNVNNSGAKNVDFSACGNKPYDEIKANGCYGFVYDGTSWIYKGSGKGASNVLTKDNTTEYTPSTDYNPATKKYVDDIAETKSNANDVYTKTEVDKLLNNKAKKPVVITITVPTTGWTTSTDTNGITYYTKNITNSTLTSTGYPITDVVLPSDIAAARLQSEAYQNVNKITVNDGSVDLYCFDSLPTVSFQIRIQLLYI